MSLINEFEHTDFRYLELFRPASRLFLKRPDTGHFLSVIGVNRDE